MTVRRLSLSVMALALAQPALAAPMAENLTFNPPDAFQVVGHSATAQQEAIYLAEPPATIEVWTRLVTGLSFHGRAHKEDLAIFYRGFSDDLKAACPGITSVEITGTVDARNAIRADINCPLHATTHRAERLTVFAVQGLDDLLMVQIAFQGPPKPTDRALIQRIAASLMVCMQPDLTGCADRKPVGFIPTR